jgi:hypothetical protein
MGLISHLGGVDKPWSSGTTLAPLILGLLGLIAFIAYSKFRAPSPIFHTDVFHSRNAMLGYFCTFVHGLLFFSILYSLSLYYQACQFLTPALTGLALFPITLIMPITALGAVFLIKLLKRYRPALHSGWFIVTLGTGLLIVLQTGTSVVAFIFITFISGIGLGILYKAQPWTITSFCPPHLLPSVTAATIFFRTIGQMLGVALTGVIFQNGLQIGMAQAEYADINEFASVWASRALALIPPLQQLDSVDMRTQAASGYLVGLRGVWIMCVVMAALATIAGLVGAGTRIPTRHDFTGSKSSGSAPELSNTSGGGGPWSEEALGAPQHPGQAGWGPTPVQGQHDVAQMAPPVTYGWDVAGPPPPLVGSVGWTGKAPAPTTMH